MPRAIRAAVSESNGATPETGSTVVADQIHQMQDQIRDEEYERLSRLCAQMAATIAPRDAWTFAGFPAWPPFVKERTVVTGADIVAWLDRDGKGGGGLADANAMLDRGLVATTGRRGCGFDDASPWRDSLFRLSDHACEPVGWPRVTMGAMNARRRWRGSNRRPARLVASDLRARILSMYDEHLSQDGTFVDYAAMAKSPAFEAYVDATAELQTVDLRELDRDEKIAFFLNVYNAMIVHVTCAVGPPRAGFFGFFDRLTFFDRFRYDIGGVPWSCDDIEHGALRGNRPGAASFGPLVGAPAVSPGPFAPDDPRRAHCVLPMDPRVHFALVCGARSCPPIRTYDAAGLDAQLAAAAEAFVDGDVAVVNADAGTFRCSKIIGEWYAEDFGVDDAERLRRVAGYLPRGSAKREAIEAALARVGEAGHGRVRLDAQRQKRVTSTLPTDAYVADEKIWVFRHDREVAPRDRGALVPATSAASCSPRLALFAARSRSSPPTPPRSVAPPAPRPRSFASIAVHSTVPAACASASLTAASISSAIARASVLHLRPPGGGAVLTGEMPAKPVLGRTEDPIPPAADVCSKDAS